MEVLWTACDVCWDRPGFAILILAESCSPLQAVLEQGSDVKGPSWEPLGQQREQAPAQQLGVDVCVFSDITGWASSLLIFNLPFPPALCPYQIPPGIASLPASFSPNP